MTFTSCCFSEHSQVTPRLQLKWFLNEDWTPRPISVDCVCGGMCGSELGDGPQEGQPSPSQAVSPSTRAWEWGEPVMSWTQAPRISLCRRGDGWNLTGAQERSEGILPGKLSEGTPWGMARGLKQEPVNQGGASGRALDSQSWVQSLCLQQPLFSSTTRAPEFYRKHHLTFPGHSKDPRTCF